jgi:type I restriction enzyme S subunit
LFAGSGETIDEIGKSAVYLKNDPCYAGGDIIIFSPKETDSLFLVHLLNMGEARKKLRELGQGQAVVHLYKSDLENLSVTIPHLPEQRRIVSILETWDRAIDEVTNEIYLKEQIKEVVTQKMLFGKNDKSAQFQKNRYLTVPSSWKIVNIGEVAKSISRKNSQNNSLPVLSCTVHRGLVDSLSFFKKQIFSKNLSTYKIVKRNQFVYATNHIEEGSIGLQDIYDEGLVSPMYTVFECDERILPEYLYPLLKTELFRHVFESATSSSVNRRGSLRWSAFSKIKIPLPSLAEQHQIIAIISASKKEIALLEKKLSNLRSQQSYILNALMTGVIRTPETTSAVTKQTTI